MTDVQRRPIGSSPPGSTAASPVGLAVEDARRAGLLEGVGTEHVSFRLPRALVEAARRETGIESKTELGVAAFAMLARPDPAVAFQVARYGALGDDFDLEY